MKTTQRTKAIPTTHANQGEFTAIEVAALDDVTGGCAACGSDCAAGTAPRAGATNATAQAQDWFARR
jgi:hypothetical protein